MRGPRPRFAAPVAAIPIVLGILLAGCGGGNSAGSSTGMDSAEGTTATSRQGQSPEPSSVKQGEGAPSPDAIKGRNGARPRDKEGGSRIAKTPPVSSAPPEGSTAVAPGVTTVPGGDNSVQTYGVESSDAERTQAATTVQAYLNARVAGQWDAACSYLTNATRAGLAQLAAQAGNPGSGSGGIGCAEGMKALTEANPTSTRRQSATIDLVLSFRIEGSQAFLLFSGPPTKTLFGVPMNLEEGEWKAAALDPSSLIVG